MAVKGKCRLNRSGRGEDGCEMNVYFTDILGILPSVIEDYGAFNVSLINDLPLFVDPFPLFNSDKPEYQDLHEEILNYMAFLRGTVHLHDTLLPKLLSGEIEFRFQSGRRPFSALNAGSSSRS